MEKERALPGTEDVSRPNMRTLGRPARGGATLIILSCFVDRSEGQFYAAGGLGAGGGSFDAFTSD